MLVGNRAGVSLTRSVKGPLLPSSFPVNGASNCRPHCSGADWATPMSSSWVTNSTNQDWLLLMHQLSPAVRCEILMRVQPQCYIVRTWNCQAKKPITVFEQLSYWWNKSNTYAQSLCVLPAVEVIV